MQNLQVRVKERFKNGIGYIGDLTILFLRTILWMTIPPFKNERTFQQAKRVGIDSFFIVSLVALFTGIILALQTAYQMQKLSSEIYIANLVSVSLVRELGPVLTALIVAGRIGAAITAEIGTMNVTEQVDALKTLASNPIKYLVVPRLLSLVIMLPVLTIYSDIIGVLGGYLICVFKLQIGATMYIRMSIDALAVKDIITGLIKTVFFGIIIAMVSCQEGLHVKGGAEGVGKSTTISVVTSFILIIISDCFFTALFYFIFRS